MKKYRIVVKDKEGHVIFDHSSDSAAKLIKRFEKESTDGDGGIYEGFFNGSYYHYYKGEQVDNIFIAAGETYIEKDEKQIRITSEG